MMELLALAEPSDGAWVLVAPGLQGRNRTEELSVQELRFDSGDRILLAPILSGVSS